MRRWSGHLVTAHDVLGGPGSGLKPGPAAVVAPVRRRVTRWQVAFALVDLSGVGSSASAHLLASLRSFVRGYAGWIPGGARRSVVLDTADGAARGSTPSPLGLAGRGWQRLAEHLRITRPLAHLIPDGTARRLLTAGALPMLASGPAAGSTLAFFELFFGPTDATFPGRPLLRILHPADEFVAGQGCDVVPGIKSDGVGDQRCAQVPRKLVHDSSGHSGAAHSATVAGRGEPGHRLSSPPGAPPGGQAGRSLRQRRDDRLGRTRSARERVARPNRKGSARPHEH